jgi:hypothetical protein
VPFVSFPKLLLCAACFSKFNNNLILFQSYFVASCSILYRRRGKAAVFASIADQCAFPADSLHGIVHCIIAEIQR